MSKSFITGNHNHHDEDGSALPQTNLFLEDSKIEVDDDSIVVLSAKEKRVERKRQRQVSVSKLYYFAYYQSPNSKHRKPNFPPLPVLGHASLVLGHKWSKTLRLNGKAH
jgi:hypothetical protein